VLHNRIIASNSHKRYVSYELLNFVRDKKWELTFGSLAHYHKK
jgi:hypothetical protein